MDLVLEDVIVPVHAVGHHHKRRPMLDQVPRHEGMLGKAPRPVALPVAGGEPLDVKQIGARCQPPHPLEGGILTASDRASSLALEPRREELPQRLAGLAVVSAEGIGGSLEELRVVAAEAHRGVLHAEPAGPVPRLEALELIPPRNRIEEDEVGDR